METNAEKSQEQPELTGEDQVIDTTQNSQDESIEGATDDHASYEDEVAALARGELPASEAQSNDTDDSEGVEGETILQDEETEQSEESSEQVVEEESEEENDDDTGETASRFRLRTDDPVEARAFQLRTRNPDIPILECMKMAEAEISPDNSSESEHYTEDQSPTVEDIESQIDALTEKQATHLEEYENSEAVEVGKEIKELNKQLRQLDRAEIRQDVASEIAHDRYNQAYEANYAQAVDAYPQLNDPDSQFYKLVAELDEANEKDASYANSPNRPLIVAAKAAEYLGLSPKGKGQSALPPAAKKTAKSRPVSPARGNAKTTQPVKPASKLADAVDGIETVEDYERLMASMEG